MNFPSWFIEISATYVECTVILAAVAYASGRKYSGKRHIFLLALFSLLTTIIITALNLVLDFSYITPVVSMSFVIFISSKVLGNGSLLVRSVSAILSHLFIQCIDYISVILIGHLAGRPEDFFRVFVSSQDVNRATFLIVDKSIDIIAYFLLRKHLSKLSKLAFRLCRYLLILSITSYVVMQFLFQVVLVPNLPVMQLAVVASWCFLIGFIAAFIAFFLSLTRQEQDRQRLEMLRSENTLMAENYKTLHSAQKTYARTVHDFKHHVTTLRDLVSTEKPEAAIKYMNSLLMTSYHQATLCHSGNDIVDAIINSKLSEAQAKGIQFTFMANFHIPIQIDPVDLCGVLANQLENAFEACMQIPDPAERLVHAEIKQVQSFVILRVENTVLSDPFANNPHLHSTKSNLSVPHGYGLLNIRSIAQKYEGILRMEFTNGRFVSVVSLCDPTV